MRLVPLTLEHLQAIAPRLCARHREEILRRFECLEDWVRNRAQLAGLHYVIEDASGPMVVGGVCNEGSIGHIWFACADDWERYLLAMLRFFREVRRSGAYRVLVCECCADNRKARDFVERMGFAPYRTARSSDFLSYRMAL
jgi:RimJ/RimL family protein N-acetyltransferase